MERVVGPGFHEQVFAVVRRIPRGRVATYGQIAGVLGSPKVARHVGFALAAVGNAKRPVPWHRVVNARGQVSPRSDGLASEDQYDLLESEGVEFRPNGSVDLRRYRHVFPEETEL